jgi:hypothetical protein
MHTHKGPATLIIDDGLMTPFYMRFDRNNETEWSKLDHPGVWSPITDEPTLVAKVAALESEKAKLAAELAELKKAKAPGYDYTKPRGGDLFRDNCDGSLNMAITGTGTAVVIVCIHGTGTGKTWAGRDGFSQCMDRFAYLGNVNDNPSLLKESLP